MRKIDEKEIQFLHFSFPENERYNGNILFYRLNTNKINPLYPCYKTFIGFYPITRINDIDLYYYQRSSYCLTANTFKKDQRNESHLFGLNNIVIRIYDKDFCDPEVIYKNHETLRYSINTNICCNYGIPEPNFIMDCGNAIEIWYTLDQAAAALKWIYIKVANDLCTKYKKMIKKDPSIKGMKVDFKKSCDIKGLFMMPGSINHKVNKLVTCEHIGNERINLIAYYKNILETQASKFARNIKKNSTKNLDNYNILAVKRMKMFEALLPEIKKGKRDKFLFCVFCTAIHLMNEKEALEYTFKMNELLKDPMSVQDVLKYLTAAKEKKYKLSNLKIAKMLSIDDAQLKIYGLYTSKNRTYIPKTSAKDREIRNRKILRDAKKGYLERELAVMYRLTESAVSKILGKFMFDPVYWRRKKRVNEIKKMKTNNISEIAHKLGISKLTVYSLLVFVADISLLKKRVRKMYTRHKCELNIISSVPI